MRSILFAFRPTVSPERQEACLAAISSWGGVSKVGHLKPDATSQELMRLGYAYVDDNATIGAILERLSSVPELEDVTLPAERRLC